MFVARLPPSKPPPCTRMAAGNGPGPSGTCTSRRSGWPPGRPYSTPFSSTGASAMTAAQIVTRMARRMARTVSETSRPRPCRPQSGLTRARSDRETAGQPRGRRGESSGRRCDPTGVAGYVGPHACLPRPLVIVISSGQLNDLRADRNVTPRRNRTSHAFRRRDTCRGIAPLGSAIRTS